MRQKVDFEKRKVLFSRRIEFELPKKMSEVQELRARVRLAETAAKQKIAARPERPAN
jgi:hypothetical protein